MIRRVVMTGAACAALALGSAEAAAQGAGLRAPPAAGFGALVGVVDDSLHGGPLVGASVMVLGSGAPRTALTDAAGLFRIDSITPGDIQIIVRHPQLDSLLITVTSAKFTVTADRLDEVSIATPSVARFRDSFCPRGGVRVGQAIIAGRVDEADTGEPLANAVVSLVYTDGGPSTSPRVRTARSNANGFYAICGVPENIEGTVQAAVGTHASAEVGVSTKANVLVTAGFLVVTGSDTGTGSAVLRGRITDVAGRPVADAQVAVEGGKSIARTAEDGTYSLTDLPSGTTNASVRKIGFAQAFRTVHLRKSEPQVLNVQMAAGTRQLAPVTITATADKALDKLGFTERLKMGSPNNFLTPDQIAKRENVAQLTDLFRMMPGFIVQNGGANKSVLASSRAVNGGQQSCVNVFVDRMPFQQLTAGDLDAAFPLYTIGAIESYPTGATTPAEFRLTGQSCATVVIRTKMKLNR